MDNYKENFIKLHKEEFEKYKSEIEFKDLRENFGNYNNYFTKKEVSTLIKSINDLELLYRNRDSHTWYSHGELSYTPFLLGRNIGYLTLYFYLIANSMDDVDFYPSNKSMDDIKMPFIAESINYTPVDFYLIEGKYKVDENLKVIID